ncbi:hypothetical protein QWY86_04310 [Pedobacter aquatilis]|uniref:hypothetical protein n=1 Tax=Pedobacter aquatilis TaxID=351343 RepID=UPI0025B4F022|nr:hypothetical protein [Pedobacter aquatilis]MDN3585877.1 hypothetical protein [Pedobacter aquatilis]
MQPIQDKDFDKLFKNAFEDAEIAPSRDLWSSIESEIEPKKKRIIPIYWLSAAAVLLIATVGILVYQQQDVKPKQYANNVKFKAETPVLVEDTKIDTSVSIVKPVEKLKQALPISAKPVTTLAKTKAKEETKIVEKQRVVNAFEVQKQEQMIAKVEEPQKDIKTKIEEAILQPKQETVIAANPIIIKTDDVENDNNQAENKGIRNVGDVVNLIVNKVDKRKDKFIQFRTDDDDSSLSSINIGPFKIGKKKK